MIKLSIRQPRKKKRKNKMTELPFSTSRKGWRFGDFSYKQTNKAVNDSENTAQPTTIETVTSFIHLRARVLHLMKITHTDQPFGNLCLRRSFITHIDQAVDNLYKKEKNPPA